MFSIEIIYPILLAGAGCAAVALIVPRMIPLALRYGLVDHPDIRTVRNSPTPLCGGIAVFVPVAATLAVFAYLTWGREISFRADPVKVGSFLLGMCWILFIGIIDDKKTLSWKQKLLGQAIGVLILMMAGHSARSAYLPLIGPVEFGIAGPLVFGLAVIFIMNAINLIDGIDGLAAGVSLTTSLVYGIVGYFRGDIFACTIGFVLSGSLLGFMFYNLPPAKVFLGDAGSLTLGFVLGTLAISSATSMSPGQRSATFTSLLVPLFPLSLALLDVFLSILRRWIRGASICAPDTDHLHHRLISKFKRPKIVLLTMCGFSGVLGIVSILVALAPKGEFSTTAASLFILTCLMAATAILYLYRTDRLSRVFRERRHFKFLDRYLAFMSVKLEMARSRNDVIESLESGVKDLGFDSVTVFLDQKIVRQWVNPSPLHPECSRVFLRKRFREPGLTLRAMIPQHDRKSYQDHLEYTWARALEIFDKKIVELGNAYQHSLEPAGTVERLIASGKGPGRTESAGWNHEPAGAPITKVSRISYPAIAPSDGVATISADSLVTTWHHEPEEPQDYVTEIDAQSREQSIVEALMGFDVINAGRDWCIDSIEDWLKNGSYCRWLACLNPHSYAAATKKKEFHEALQEADWVVPDGTGIDLPPDYVPLVKLEV